MPALAGAFGRSSSFRLRVPRKSRNDELRPLMSRPLMSPHVWKLKADVEMRVVEVAQQAPYADAVGRLRCFHGIDFITALTILVELHDLRRDADGARN